MASQCAVGDAKLNKREIECYLRSCSMRTRATLEQTARPLLACISPARSVHTRPLSRWSAETAYILQPTPAEKDNSVNGK